MSVFTWLPDATLTQDVVYNTLTTDTTYGKERRRNKWNAPRRKWTLQFIDVTGTTCQEIMDFYTAREFIETFDWVNPLDGVTYTVRFGEPSLGRTYKQYNLYDVTITFLEVI